MQEYQEAVEKAEEALARNGSSDAKAIIAVGYAILALAKAIITVNT